ncbi:dihydrofolate reductase [Jeotgalibaca ciconiae]|uniref:Dihydrofolate reductase n=1 Tax=Jeotgalibaca ciconiae TaxID=2496265 RepID=A0A3S9HDG4_9LACT|nr:dihydrofolate reductase [Jeotgalibaca ciconiae]AZP05361.1 dihydrofolate reductase [Jeotgalibaca ciconiae]HJB22586.1 dihydrofolate reductase [Candidatus Jeotgalibaca pullicola]
MFILIWAEDETGAIGKGGGLPWSLPNDMKFFKDTTTEHTVVMGRKTFESMGKRPLPKRNNIILTRQEDYQADHVTVVHDLKELKKQIPKRENIYVIGGSEIYRLFLPIADVLWRTKVSGNFDGDTFFPEVNWQEWRLAEEKEGIVDAKNQHKHVFQKFIKMND